MSRRQQGTEHIPGKEIFVGNQSSVGSCVVQAAMEICWPEPLPEEEHYETTEIFVFCSFCLFCL